MTISEFLRRWETSGASERANYQLFLSELCGVLNVPRPDPSKSDDESNAYVFEKSVKFTHGDNTTSLGRIDLYKRGCFVLEAKQGTLEAAPVHKGHGKRHSHGWDEALIKARNQAESYARALPASEGWPPFLLVVDVGFSIEVYADFSCSGKTYTAFPDPSCHRIYLGDLQKPEILDRLKAIWTDPLSLDPARRTARVTREVADTLATLAKSLEASGFDPRDIFDFLMRSIFTMFAEDVKLLPERSFVSLLEQMEGNPAIFQGMLESLWTTMAQGGFSPVLRQKLLRFNGGLFEDARALPLTKDQIHTLSQAADHDWRDVEPAIFGTLVERALDPHDRHKLGAHYTPRAYVERLVLPTIIEPLRAEWDAVKVEVQAIRTEAETLRKKGSDKKADTKGQQAIQAVHGFHKRLCSVKVLDPACGSGNFLYVTLEHMKRLEAEVHVVLLDLGDTRIGLELEGVTVSPVQFLGLEINPRAAAIADLVLWIGYLQWHLRTHGGAHPKEPVIEKFHTIENRDALIEHDGIEPVTDSDGRSLMRWDGRTTKTHPVTGVQVPDESATVPVVHYKNPRPTSWPQADFIVGNPPFIGTKRVRQILGDGYVEAVRVAWKTIPDSTDFVMYWWKIASDIVLNGNAKQFGFITTNSISQFYNRKILEQAFGKGLCIGFAIPDHPWVDSSDGASIRIAMTIGKLSASKLGTLAVVTHETATEDGLSEVQIQSRIGEIQADLSIGAAVMQAKRLSSNAELCWQGCKLVGSGFQLSPAAAQKLLAQEPQSRELIREYWAGSDLNKGRELRFVLDTFELSLEDLRSRFPVSFQWLFDHVKPEREQNQDRGFRESWWLFGRARPDLRRASERLHRIFVTSEVSKHRFFIALEWPRNLIDGSIVAVASDDMFHMGILSSSVHSKWCLSAGGTLEDRPRYQIQLCFDSFPFPVGTTESTEKIRQIAERLDAHRKRQQELHDDLTMTGMYNVLEALREGRALTAKEKAIHEKGLVSLLKEIHDELDRAVFVAYGWPASISDEQILERLVALNGERATEEASGLVRWLRPDFQNPNAKPAELVQEDLDLSGAVEPGATSKGKGKAKKAASKKEAKAPWPETTREQIQTLRTALVFLGSTVSAEDLASRFQGAKPEQVAVLLEAMSALGQIREEEGRFAA
jgi:hypothetical protein